MRLVWSRQRGLQRINVARLQHWPARQLGILAVIRFVAIA